jgi:hypothetical protein
MVLAPSVIDLAQCRLVHVKKNYIKKPLLSGIRLVKSISTLCTDPVGFLAIIEPYISNYRSLLSTFYEFLCHSNNVVKHFARYSKTAES